MQSLAALPSSFRRVVSALAALVLLSVLLAPGAARAEFKPPPIKGFVTDTAGKLSADEVRALDEKLAAYRRSAKRWTDQTCGTSDPTCTCARESLT